MSEPQAGEFRTPKQVNGRRKGKNAGSPIRHEVEEGEKESSEDITR